MTAILITAGYLLGVVLLGGLLAYPASLLFPEFAFHRVLGRSLLLTALLVLPVFARLTGCRDRAAFGFGVPAGRFVRDLGKGFAVGLATISVLLVVLMVLDIRVFRPQPFGDEDAVFMLRAVGIAVVVATLEETLFRGIMLNALLQSLRTLIAVFLSAAVYASVHFLQFRTGILAEPESWNAGLMMIGNALARYAEPAAIADAWMALFTAGVLLAGLRLATGHIGAAIGLHAAWILGIKFTHRMTDLAPESGFAWMVGQLDGVMGWLSAIWITVFGGLWWLLWRNDSR